MFENINLNTTPNNLCSTFISKCPTNQPICRRPYEEYNEVGEFVGYSWHYGDTVTLEFTIEGELTLEDNSIIFTAKGSQPESTTVGKVGQKAYNTTDIISWTCTAANPLNDVYTWEKDGEWITPSTGANTYVTVKDYLKGKYFNIDIYNFRYEKEFTSLPIPAEEIFTFNITSKMVEKPSCGSTNIKTDIKYEPLDRGVHYLTLILTDENNEYVDTLIGQQNCPLIIK